MLALVASSTHTIPINAGAVAPTGRIDALVHRHITLGTLPAAVALACSFGVLSIPTAQDGAGSCKTKDRTPGHRGSTSEGPCLSGAAALHTTL